jgi:Carboxypeptidase regulatory-like domain
MNSLIGLLLTLAVLAPATEVTGTIVNDDGKLVSGVPIQVVAIYTGQVMQKTLSGSDGTFRFTGLAPGGYGVSAKTDSACAFSNAIQVNAGFTSIVRLRLIDGMCRNALIYAEPGRTVYRVRRCKAA